jgi:NTE family protein
MIAHAMDSARDHSMPQRRRNRQQDGCDAPAEIPAGALIGHAAPPIFSATAQREEPTMSQRVKAAGKPTIVLVLQGGGALGAYQIGAYEAMAESGFEPHWFAGTSIGAINVAILAGNKPETRLARLTEFWHAISRSSLLSPSAPGPFRLWFDALSIDQSLLFGQPNFFTPRALPAFPAPPETVSFYDTTPLLATLRDLADFDLINSGAVRVSLGATNVETGNLEFFDTAKAPVTTIDPAHVLASGSLPPGFAATKIGEKFFWDGGVLSNTPLEAVLQDLPQGHTIAFVIDLWRASGPAPHTFNDVMWREKQIQFASRTTQHIDAVATKVNLRCAMTLLTQAKAPEVDHAVTPDVAAGPGQRLDIVHIIYHPEGEQLAASDTEFSRGSIEARRQAGHRDMARALAATPWLRDEAPARLGAIVHTVAAGRVTTLPEPNLRSTAPQ